MVKATFAAGCFWGVQAEFDEVPGVLETTVGYTGGTMANPSYQDVCSGRTGHAETCDVIFDPEKISYPQLLDVFWSIHDPTTRDRQGPDVGAQYRSAIFYHSPEQRAQATESKQAIEASGRYKRPVVTEISAAGPFYRAEEYHQKYLAKQGRVGSH